MAERLTKKIFDETGKQQVIYEWSSVSSLECNRKLGKLEDILEKYGIESVEELDNILSWLYTLSGQDIELMKFIAQERKQIHDMYCETKKDRDTWRKACELASETLKQVMGKPLWIGGNIPTPEVKDSDYFYQQAKKEKES